MFKDIPTELILEATSLKIERFVKTNEVWHACFEFYKNKLGIHKSSNVQLIDFPLFGISVLQSPQILCEPGNYLNQKFPALIFHIKEFKPIGTNTLQFQLLV